jgi:hypothetical protein
VERPRLRVGLALYFAVVGAEVFNPAFGQRFYIARDAKRLRIGFAVGMVVVSLLPFLFGVVGLLLAASVVGRKGRAWVFTAKGLHAGRGPPSQRSARRGGAPGYSVMSVRVSRAGIVPVAVFTLVYTMFGGLPPSIMTDVLQAVAGGALHRRLRGGRRQRRPAVQGVRVERPRLRVVWSLCFAVVGAEIFDPAFRQRFYIARDAKQLRIGFAVGWSWSLS